MKNSYLLILLCFGFLTSTVSAQCPPGTFSVGSNLVVNGDFSAGNTGFNSGYSYGTGGIYGLVSNAGQYAIVTSANNAHVNYAMFGDHTTGSGNLLVVNGAGVANVNIWCQNIVVQPNTVYTFSTWITSANSTSPAILQFSINGTTLATPFAASPDTGMWQQFFTTWYSGLNTNANICIVNQNTSTIGNDFAIDDINFQECECNFATDAGPDTTVCEGSVVQLNATGGDSYQWYPFNGLNNPAISNPVATITGNTTYYAIISNAIGCIDTASVSINVTPLQQVSAGINDTICFGDSVQINAIGNGNISWFPATGLSNPNILNPIASPAQTTEYILTIEDGPCMYNDTVTIFVKQLPQPDAGIDLSLCEGSSIQLNGSGIGTPLWYPSAGLSNPNILNPVAAPAQTTTYYLNLQLNGCVKTDSVTITVNALPLVNADTDKEICAGNSVQLNGSGNGNIQWYPSTGLNNTSITNPIASPLQTTTYIISVIANGCENTDTVIISVKPLPQVNAGTNDSICYGQSVQLAGNGSGLALWNPGSTLNNVSVLNPVASPGQTTTYVLQIDSAGCTNSDSVTIFVKQLPNVFAGIDDTICAGESIQLIGSGIGNVAWSPTPSLNNNSILNPVATPAQTTDYVLTIEEDGCYNTDTVIIYVKQLPVVNAGNDQSICEGSSIQLNGTGTGIISWFPDSGMNNPSIPNPVISPAQTTIFSLTISSDGCENTDSVKITVIPLPQVNAGVDDTICAGEAIQLNGNGTGSALWSPSQSLNNSFILNPVATPGLTTIYVLTIEENGCTNKDSVAIFVKQLPQANAGIDQSICEGSSIQLNGAGTGIVSWSPDSGMNNPYIPDPVISPDQTTIYILTVLSDGCENSDSVKITVVPLPDVDAGDDRIVCFGESLQLSASGASNYSWTPSVSLNNANTANPVAFTLETTEYIVTGILNGCTNYDTITVEVAPLPVVNAGNDTIVPKETNYILTGFPSGGNWSSDDGMLCTACTDYNMIITKDQQFYYHYIDSNGCENADTVFIYLNRTCKDPFFPTAFSPNDDLLNDTFLPVFEDIHVVLEVEFIIYNKWGEEVFYTNKINNGWDGKTKILSQTTGLYAYVFKYSCEKDSKVIKGSFTLVR